MRLLLLLAMAVLLGCRDQAPPAPSAEQSDQLNDAGNSLNSFAQNEEGPEANASGPSNASD